MEKTISKTPMITADYFSEEGLIKQVGLNKGWWNQIILKELIDNALDAIEPLKKKEIHIEINTERLGIYDNGSGIKKDIVKSIYDFNNYVSQNRNYITASRGKQGNGLKTIISIRNSSNHFFVMRLKNFQKIQFVRFGRVQYIFAMKKEILRIPLKMKSGLFGLRMSVSEDVILTYQRYRS